MDRLDVAIIRELFQGLPTSPTRPEIKLSYRTISRRLGVAEGTVRTRARALSDSGFIRGYALHPNPKLLGLKVCCAFLEVAEGPKGRVIEQLGLLEGAILLVNYHGSSAGQVFLYSDEKSLHRKLELAGNIAGGQVQAFTEIPYPPCGMHPGNLDWRILSSLQGDIRKSYGEVAKELGLSARTVKRRVTKMTRSGAAFLLPSGDETKLKDTLRADLWIRYGTGGPVAETQLELLAFLEDYRFFTGLWPSLTVFNLFIPSVPTSKEILEKTRGMRGVEDAHIEFVDERLEFYDIYRDMVKGKLAREFDAA